MPTINIKKYFNINENQKMDTLSVRNAANIPAENAEPYFSCFTNKEPILYASHLDHFVFI